MFKSVRSEYSYNSEYDSDEGRIVDYETNSSETQQKPVVS